MSTIGDLANRVRERLPGVVFEIFDVSAFGLNLRIGGRRVLLQVTNGRATKPFVVTTWPAPFREPRDIYYDDGPELIDALVGALQP